MTDQSNPHSISARVSPISTTSDRRDPAWNQIHDALRGLRFGVVSIIVQDGVVVQIERTEKRRLC